MSWVRKETVLSIEDLRYVTITCPHCQTQVILDMANYNPLSPDRLRERMAFAPRQCPACRVSYDTALTALNELQQAYATLANLPGIVSFRAPVE